MTEVSKNIFKIFKINLFSRREQPHLLFTEFITIKNIPSWKNAKKATYVPIEWCLLEQATKNTVELSTAKKHQKLVITELRCRIELS